MSVFIVTRVRLYREGLARALSSCAELEFTGAAADAAGGLSAVARLQPSVVLVDLDTAGRRQFARACARAAPGSRLLALIVSDSDDELLGAAEAGISGYVTYDSSINQMIGAVQSVAAGEMLCPPRVAAALMRRVGILARRGGPEPADLRLTARELEIAELIDAGLSNKEIAHQLFIELPTVKNHVHNILEKLSVARRSQAVAKLREDGFIGAVRTANLVRPPRG